MPQLLTQDRPVQVQSVSGHHADNAKTLVPTARTCKAPSRSSVAAKSKSIGFKAQNSRQNRQQTNRPHGSSTNADEPLLLSNARHCLETVRSSQSDGRTMTAAETANWLDQLTQPPPQRRFELQPAGIASTSLKPEPCESTASHAKGHPLADRESQVAHRPVRVQLKLSKSLIRVLTAFHKAGQRPGNIVEKTMWQDACIQDAAAIIGVQLPIPKPDSRAISQ